MKILLVHNYYQLPGGEDAVFDHDRKILEQGGHEVLTYCRSNNELSEMSLAQRMLSLDSFISSGQTKREIAELLRRHKPDLVHVYNTFTMITPAVFDACRQAGVPTVLAVQNYRLLCPTATLFREGKICNECQEHGLWNSVKHACYRESRFTTAAMALSLETYRRRGTWNTHVDAYIVPSQFVKQKLTETSIPKAKVFLRPNFLSSDPKPRKSPGSYALFVGRLSQEKGLCTLLNAWKLARVDMPLRIVGDGPLRPSIESQIAASGLNNVVLSGWLDRSAVHRAIQQAQFLIFPSEWYEPFGLTIVEAFACGVPVIGSRLGAVQELIDDNRTGLLFSASNAEDLAKKINWAFTHPEELRAMGHAARQKYEQQYSAEVNYARLLSIYSHLLERNAPNTATL